MCARTVLNERLSERKEGQRTSKKPAPPQQLRLRPPKSIDDPKRKTAEDQLPIVTVLAMSRNNPNDGNFVISVAKPQLEPPKRLSSSASRQPRSGNNGDLDPDYREYFRPRGGEFLTRGAQLASTQLVGTDYGGGTVGTPVGSLASHLDAIGINGASAQARNAALASAQLIDSNGGINTVSMSRLQVSSQRPLPPGRIFFIDFNKSIMDTFFF